VRISTLLSTIICTILLVGCGKKDSIYLPEEKANKQTSQSAVADPTPLRLLALQEK